MNNRLYPLSGRESERNNYPKELRGVNLGFGTLGAHRCVVYDICYLSDVCEGVIAIDNLSPKLVLDMDDADAVPFGMITDKTSMFIVGRSGGSHRELFAKFSSCAEAGLCGRLWLKSKHVILKISDNFIEDIPILYNHLLHYGIDISDFAVLLLKRNADIYDAYWGDIYSYNVAHILSYDNEN